MKKNLIAIGVMCAILLALGLGFFFLREETAPTPELSGPTPVSYLFQYTRPPLSVRLEGSGREPYTLKRLEYDSQRGLVTGSAIPEMEGLPLDTTRVNAVLSASRSLSYLELVADDIADVAPFGLTEPRGRVTLDFEELGRRTIIIGDVAPGNIGVYIQLEEGGAVYLSPIHGLDNFLLSALDFLDMNVTPLIGWPPAFDEVALGGQVRQDTGEILIATADDGERRLLLPFEHELSPLSVPGALYPAFGIVAMGVALTRPTREDLETLGLYPAWSTLTAQGAEFDSFTLHASRPDEGGMVFLYREGVPVVYTALSHDMHWLEAQFYQLMSPFAVSPTLNELARIEVDTLRGFGQLQFRFRFAVEGTEDELTIYSTGGPLDTDNFRRFFTNLTSVTLEYLAEQPDELGQLDVSFRYVFRSGEVIQVHFYASEIPLRHYIRVDDGRVFLTPSAYLDRVIWDAIRVGSGEQVEAY